MTLPVTPTRTMPFTAQATEQAPSERPPEQAPRAALTGCPWHDVKTSLRDVGLRPTRQRMELGWLLFGKGDRHITAEMLHHALNRAKTQFSLATVYNPVA